jgi:hypothetical protein
MGTCVRVTLGLALLLLGDAVDSLANAVQSENAKQGTAEWKITAPGYATGAIEGYASLTSVNRGGRIEFFVTTQDPSYRMDFFRIGYYGGLGGRRMLPTITRTGTVQPACPMDSLGMVECNWTNPYVFTVPNSTDPTDWMSGIYVVKLTAATSGKQQYIIFAVRDDARASDLLMAQTVTTYQAYNRWGGKSLYGTLANGSDTANKAMKVSFDRPYLGTETFGAGQFFGSGLTRPGREQAMVQWLEREGYDVTYATNIDVDENPSLLWNHKAFLSVGHDEYWSWKMRDNVEAARDRGVNLGFFSGNTSYWQVRFEPSVSRNAPSRVMVGYKEFWKQDPITPDYLKTNEFRYAPVNRSEDAMIGVRFVTQAKPALCVEDASHWAFTGTGLKNGDCLLNADGTPFLGYEVDAMGPFSPANTQRLAHSPATPRRLYYCDMTVYRAAGGATVFSIGSIEWSLVLPQTQQITRNVLARFVAGAFVDTTPIRPLPPDPFRAIDIGNTGRPGFVALAGSDSFTLNGGGGDQSGGQDTAFFVYQPLTGDAEITARLLSLENFWNNRAGLVIRESLDPGSKAVMLLARPSLSSGAVNEGAELRIKASTGATQATVAALDQPQPNWLRLSRSGNAFSAYLSPDGLTWTLVGTTTVSMSAAAQIGVAVHSAQRGVWVTAQFDHVSVKAGPSTALDTTKPTVSITSPASGSSVSSAVSVSAAASDNAGVAGVQFRLDGSNLGTEDTSAPYAVSWDTTKAANGPHTLSAVARDAAGNTATATVSVNVSNPVSAAGTVVLWTGQVRPADIHGNWQLLSDGTAAGGAALFNPDAAAAKISPALASPAHYFEMSFPADRGTPYHLWVRLRAQGNAFANDSVHIQFNDAVNQTGSPIMRSGTSASAEVVLQNGPTGPADHGWGWADNGWGTTPQKIYFATAGVHTLRVQQREDGALVDQIVLSPDQYLNVAPGPRQDDTTVLATASGPCAVSFSPTSSYVGAPLATWSINVSSSGTWTIRSDVDWLEIKDPATGLFVHGADLTFTGTATVRVHARTNPGAKRKASFSIGGQVYSVTQGAAPGF